MVMVNDTPSAEVVELTEGVYIWVL